MSSDNRVDNIEDEVRKLGENKARGTSEQLEAFNKIQDQMVNINSEKSSDLQAEKIYSTLENQNNQNIEQLSELVVDNPSQQVINPQVTRLNPETINILNKYGYNQPIKKSSKSQNTQITPDKIIINNNTENNTTNNVQIPQQQPIINQPTIRQDGNVDKFKVWLNNEFARQKEQSAIREREFEKKEWSLNRSNSKLMAYLEDLGKGFAENLDPQKIGNIFGDQLKTLYFLLGFQYLANNWEKILNGVASIENWIKDTAAYFGIGERGRLLSSNGGGFKNDLKVFLGGEKNQSLKDVFLGLFKSGAEMLMERLKIFFQDRADAMKSVKFPDIISSYKNDGLIGVLKSLGLYLGDILSCLVGGRAELVDTLKSGMERISDSSHVGKKKGIHKGKVSYTDDSDIKDTSLGDAAILVGGNKSQDWLEKSDLNSEGDLSNNLAASVRQSNSVRSYLKEEDSSTIHTGSIMSGLENLKNSSKNYGKTLVGLDFFQTLGKEFGIDLSDLKGKIPIGNYKFVKVKKTDKELGDEGVMNPLGAGISKGIERKIRNEANDALGVIGDFVSLTDEDIIENPIWQGAKAFGKAQIAKWTTNTNKLELVPMSDPRPGVETEVEYNGKKIKGNVVHFYELTPEVIDAIEKKLAKKLNYDNFEIGFNDPESLRRLNNLLVEARKKKINSRFKKSRYRDLKLSSLKSDIDIESYDNTIRDLNKKIEDRHKKYEEKRKESQFGKFTNNVENGVIEIYDRVNSLFREAIGKPHVVFGDEREFVKNMISSYEKALESKGLDKNFAKYLVAQDALESAWGSSVSGRYNFGGIKVEDSEKNKGKGRRCKTKEWKNGEYVDTIDEFRNFNSPEDYANYHINFLNKNRYRSFDGGVDEFIYRTTRGGYATDPEYSNKLQNVVESIELTMDDIKEDEARKLQQSSNKSKQFTARKREIHHTKKETENSLWNNNQLQYPPVPNTNPELGESFFEKRSDKENEDVASTTFKKSASIRTVNFETSTPKYTVPALDENNFTNVKLTEVAENIKLQTNALIVYGENIQNLATVIAANSGTGQNITINNSPVQRAQAPSFTPIPGTFKNNIGD